MMSAMFAEADMALARSRKIIFGLSLSAVFESADRCFAAEQPRRVAFSTSLSKPSTGGLLHPLSIRIFNPQSNELTRRIAEMFL